MKAEGRQGEAICGRAATKYALRVIRLYEALPSRDGVAEVLGKQLLRSATSVGSDIIGKVVAQNQTSDFVSKLEGDGPGIDESALWLELLVEVDVLSCTSECNRCEDETNELISMFVTMTQEREASKPDFEFHPSAFIPHPSCMQPTVLIVSTTKNIPAMDCVLCSATTATPMSPPMWPARLMFCSAIRSMFSSPICASAAKTEWS